MKINYGLIAYNPRLVTKEGKIQILHFCGYEKPIQEESIEQLRDELTTEKKFGLTEWANGLIIQEATPDIVSHYREAAKNI
jgi:lipopolysaccharide biosynthesis glycosyltransferase